MSMYSIADYGDMVNDSVRIDAYVRALKAAIHADSIVVDIGAGTGIFSLLACQLGAKLVYAIEPNIAIEVARQSAVANGFSSRIVFYQSESTAVELPEKADVIVSDLRGALPLYGSHLAAIKDARKRFLAPNGVMIPTSDSLWAAIVNAPEQHKGCNEPWNRNSYNLDLTSGARYVFNQVLDGPYKKSCLLAAPQQWAELDYRSDNDSSTHNRLRWTINVKNQAHGINVWFDTQLLDDIGYSNKPDDRNSIYGQSFFPWPQSVELETEDEVEIELRADLVNEEYFWTWNTTINRAKQLLFQFNQSTFSGTPISPSKLHKMRGNFKPHLTNEGRVTQSLLTYMMDSRDLCTIATQIFEEYPHQFRDLDDALGFAGRVSHRYSQ